MSSNQQTTDSSRDLANQFANRLSTQEHTGGDDKIGQCPPNASSSVKKEWALLRDPVIHSERLDAIRSKKGYIIDMDGVIYHVSLTCHSAEVDTDVFHSIGNHLVTGCQRTGGLFTKEQQKVHLFD